MTNEGRKEKDCLFFSLLSFFRILATTTTASSNVDYNLSYRVAKNRQARGQFHQHSTSSFFVWKFLEQLFCTYIVGLYFFGVRKLGQKLCIKCWWNWPQAGKVQLICTRPEPLTCSVVTILFETQIFPLFDQFLTTLSVSDCDLRFKAWLFESRFETVINCWDHLTD